MKPMHKELREALQEQINEKLPNYYIWDDDEYNYSGSYWRGDPRRTTSTSRVAHVKDKDFGEREVPAFYFHAEKRDGEINTDFTASARTWGVSSDEIYAEGGVKMFGKLVDKLREKNAKALEDLNPIPSLLEQLRQTVPNGLCAKDDAELLTNLINHFKYAPESVEYIKAKNRFEKKSPHLYTLEECRDAVLQVFGEASEGEIIEEVDIKFYIFEVGDRAIHFSLPYEEGYLLIAELIVDGDPVKTECGETPLEVVEILV
ncbi:hypothetical protein BNJ_00135 [Kaumoebavirus]|uniref:hypothetical protein n=1 Tax=Kaumoebavirus TaxID=1859492 RepID=UPI0009C2E89E|nr:hypothetical protein BNJ_00135 [Kaumoebavirus]ARA71967.1 hypothetical protein BNJ_00135 [Kaumoebavirus]